MIYETLQNDDGKEIISIILIRKRLLSPAEPGARPWCLSGLEKATLQMSVHRVATRGPDTWSDSEVFIWDNCHQHGEMLPHFR